MTINQFIEMICLDNADQLVTIYDRNNNIIYHGKADFAPLNLFDDVTTTETKTVTTIDGDTVTVLNINERVSDTQIDKIKSLNDHVCRAVDEYNTAAKKCRQRYSKDRDNAATKKRYYINGICQTMQILGYKVSVQYADSAMFSDITCITIIRERGV